MVEVAVGGGGELERAEADVVQGLVVDAIGLVRVLHQLVHREGRVVRLHNRVRNLRLSLLIISVIELESEQG